MLSPGSKWIVLFCHPSNWSGMRDLPQVGVVLPRISHLPQWSSGTHAPTRQLQFSYHSCRCYRLNSYLSTYRKLNRPTWQSTRLRVCSHFFTQAEDYSRTFTGDPLALWGFGVIWLVAQMRRLTLKELTQLDVGCDTGSTQYAGRRLILRLIIICLSGAEGSPHLAEVMLGTKWVVWQQLSLIFRAGTTPKEKKTQCMGWSESQLTDSGTSK